MKQTTTYAAGHLATDGASRSSARVAGNATWCTSVIPGTYVPATKSTKVFADHMHHARRHSEPSP